MGASRLTEKGNLLLLVYMDVLRQILISAWCAPSTVALANVVEVSICSG